MRRHDTICAAQHVFPPYEPIFANVLSISACAASFVGLRHSRCVEAVTNDRDDFIAIELERFTHRDEVLIDVPAEISWIVGIDGRDQALVQHSPQRMVGEVVHHPQAQVGQRAHRQGGALARETRDQRRIFQRAIAVIDPPDAEVVEGFPHILRGPFFTGVRDREKARVAGAAKDMLEFAGRIADLGGIKPNAHDFIAMRQRRIERVLGARFVEMAQKAHDQVRADTEPALRVRDRAGEPIDHRRNAMPRDVCPLDRKHST